jgi:DNA processing protein
MINYISENTKVILMLTAPLLAGQTDEGIKLLTQKEYYLLEERLNDLDFKPENLSINAPGDIFAKFWNVIDEERLRKLLSRGFLLSQLIERWSARAIWVVSKYDDSYPEILKTRLKHLAPPILYGCGDCSLLNEGGIAIVGSRNADIQTTNHTKRISRIIANASITIISGGAKGVDITAMTEALKTGGKAIGFLADSLDRAVVNPEFRDYIKNKKLTLVSCVDPVSGFNVGNAMNRNKMIYALADAGLVMSSDKGSGGTWEGAIEQLQKLHYVPLFVNLQGNQDEGNRALMDQGAKEWVNPLSPPAMRDWFNQLNSNKQIQIAKNTDYEQEKISASAVHEPEILPSENRNEVQNPAIEMYKHFSDVMLRYLKIEDKPKDVKEMCQTFEIQEKQMTIWLTRMVEDGILIKDKKGYSINLQPNLNMLK